MQKKDTEQILLYYGKIEKQLDSVNMELAELRDRYSPIKGVAMDGMPHGSTPGDSTASLAVKLAESAVYERIYSNALVVGIEYRRGVGAALERTRYDRADGRIDKLRAHILELFSALFAELNVGVTDVFSLGLLLCRAASYDIDYIAFHVSSKNTLGILLNCMIENS